MKFIIIHNFSEAVDPEERKLRLHKIAKYAKRHTHHSRGLLLRAMRTQGEIDRASSPAERSALIRKHDLLAKQSKPHSRRAMIAKDLIKKFTAPKGSARRKSRSTAIKTTRWAFSQRPFKR